MRLLLLFIFCISVLTGNAQITGQHWGTALHNYPWKLNGRVKEIRYQNFWARQEGGEIIKGVQRDPKTNPGFFEKYNKSGVVTGASWIDNGGKLHPDFWSVKSKAKENKVISSGYYLHDSLKFNTRNIYSGDDLSEVKFFDPDEDTLMLRITYTYDQKHNRIKWKEFDSMNNLVQYVDFIYTTEGKLVKVNQYSGDGRLNYSEDVRYNEKGEWSGSHMVNHLNGITIDHEHRYEYDKYGNWTRRITYQPPKTLKMIEREIKYY